jgi:hypothetical protein
MEVSVHVCKVPEQQRRSGLKTQEFVILNLSADINLLTRRAFNPE